MNAQGKFFSILGDSISTYTHVSDGNAADTCNSTIRHNAVYYAPGTWGVMREDTWWQQAVDRLGMKLLVNNSWSGSCVLKPRFGTVGAYADRCVQLHADAGEYAGRDPDLIAVFIGTNDYSYYGDTLGTASAIDYDTLIKANADGTYSYAEPKTSCEAYAVVLHKIIRRYPHVEVFCMNLLPRRDRNADGLGQPTEFNESLAEIVSYFGCHTVDLFHSGIPTECEAFDRFFPDSRVHPNALGMDVITECFVKAVKKAKEYTTEAKARSNGTFYV